MGGPSLRALRVLEFLAGQPEPRSARAIADGTSMPRATAYRLLEELCAAGWIEGRGSPRRFRVSLRVPQLGLMALRYHRVRDAVIPNAMALAQILGRECTVSLYEAGEMMHSDSITVIGERVVPVPRGVRWPAPATSSGRCVLACLPEAEVLAVLARGVPRLTPATKTEPAELLDEIRQARQCGYAVIEGEVTAGEGGIAVAVIDATGRGVAAIGVRYATPIPPAIVASVVPQIKAFAARASAELGAHLDRAGGLP